VDGSKYPISVIIIGIGDADFSQMNVLDSDEVRLNYGGKTAERDIVQFVPMKKFTTGHVSQLAKETLCEVPDQILQLFKARKILPNPPVAAKVEAHPKKPSSPPPAATSDAPPSYEAFRK